ncbi:MAG: acyltransferase family protein [Candidatus Promineifilaceae bacterium]
MKQIHDISTFRAYLARRHFGSLDGIRAIAIIGVLWHHTTQPIDWLPMSARGFLGVDLFFVLSGWLIVTLMLRERDRSGDIALGKFYMRRTLRIFPVYYALLIVVAILFGVVARNSGLAAPFMATLPYYITYTSNWTAIDEGSLLAISWSLATEEQFYLIWPPIEKYLRPAVLPILGVLLVINQLINYGVIFVEQHAELEVLQSTFTPILLGVLLAHLMHSKEWFDRIQQLVGNRWASAVFGLLIVILLNVYPLGIDISGTPRLLIHFAMVGFLASCVVNESHVLADIMKWRPFAQIGIVSYGIYLFHMIVVIASQAILGRLGLDNMIVLFVVVMIGTYLVAEVSFRFYEKPFLKLKKRWATAHV